MPTWEASAAVSCRQPVESSNRHTPSPEISAATSPWESTATWEASAAVSCRQPVTESRRQTPAPGISLAT